MKLTSDPSVKDVFEGYPETVRKQMLHLRSLVIEAASEIDELTNLEETLKWGEPSYLTKYGSTVRMDWKAKSPTQYALYFKCTSKLVETFKTVYQDSFEFEGNRALLFQLNASLPETQLKHCIQAALKYHKIKHLPSLGL